MQYTTSDANVVHPGTGHRMHQQHEPVTTAVSSTDLNQLTWSLMEVLNDAGVAGATFDPDEPASYRKLATALNALYPARAEVDERINRTASLVKHFWHRLRSLQADCYVLVAGDSTGNANEEWVYLTAQWLAAQAPSHAVVYRLWVDGSGWSAPATLQAGSSGKTIYIDNCSVPGANSHYIEGGKEAAIWSGRDHDLVVLNYGHNFGTDMTEAVAFPEFVLALSNVRQRAPRAAVLTTMQNPRSDAPGGAQTARMVAAWRKAADLFGIGVIDVYTAFKRHSNPSSLYLDDTHPNAAGNAVWLAAVQQALAEPIGLAGETSLGLSPLNEVMTNHIPNGRFTDWTGALPTGVAANNCTAAKDIGTTEGDLYSMRVVVGAGSGPRVSWDISNALARLRGRRVTFLARIRKPLGMNALAGRIDITTTNNAGTPASQSSYPRGDYSAGGWEWAITTMVVPLDHTSMTLSVFVGADNGSDNGKAMNISAVALVEGALPTALSDADLSRRFVLDHYADTAVGKAGITVGTLTALNGTLTLDGATSPDSEAYINCYGLVPGQKYRVSWNAISCVGNTEGEVTLRQGFNGGLLNLATHIWQVGQAGQFEFTAPTQPVCLRVFGYSGATAWQIGSWSIKPVRAGRSLRVSDAKNANGSVVVASPGATDFGIQVAVGTSSYLATGTVTSATKTAVVCWEYMLPEDYIPGADLELTINAHIAGSGTSSTKTLTLAAHRIANDGSQGANLAGGVATLATAAADYVYKVTGSSLKPRERILLALTSVLTETAGGTMYTRLSSTRVA